MGKYSAARDLDLVNHTRWYLIANRGAGVIYRDRPGQAFEFVERFVDHGHGRLAEKDGDAAHSQAAAHFAQRIAKTLEVAATGQRFGRLVVIAEPRFLGVFRKEIPESVRKLIEREIPRDLQDASEARLRETVQREMAAPA